jgi:L-ascorbate metabolism protein UlaG (beta-lactamase superfamily)
VPAKIDELPQLDAIVQSHDHYDHLSRWSWRKIARLGVPVITSLGVGDRLEKFGVSSGEITELDWWESHTLSGTGVTVTATPAQHFSGRGLTDRNRTLWSSWVISSEKHRIFFSADTGLTDELAEIGKKYGPFNLTMLEIGASNEAWALLPIHWGTFDLALHPWKEPVETLLSLERPPSSRIITPPVGRPVEPSLDDSPMHWWQGLE